MPKRPKPIVLTVLDGWGYRAETKGNAIALARKPNYDRLLKDFPNTLIQTSGPSVGLPEGQMGNSEVGHMNMGAGRIIHMDITRIDLMIANGEFFKQPLLLEAMERGRARNLHLLGLLSDGGVHSHMQHLYALLRMAREQHVERVFIHCFMDGRDTPPHSGVEYIQQLQQKIREIGCGQIASLTGRYYAMDRDNRWERVERAYRAVVHGDAPVKTADPVEAVRRSYERGVTDEFIEPIVITADASPSAPPVGPIRDDDAVIFFNFRADRARQMTRAIAEPGFKEFADSEAPEKSFLRRHDAVRQVLAVAALRDRAGKNRAHPGAGFRRAKSEKSALRRNRKIRARHLFFQRRHRKTVRRRGTHSGSVAESAHLRSETGNERRRNRRHHREGRRKGRLRRHRDEFRQRRHGRTFRQIWKPRSRPSKPWTSCLGRIRQALAAARRRMDRHRRSRQRRDDDRPGHRRPAHLSHHESRAANSSPRKMASARSSPGGSLRDIAPTLLGVLGLPVPEEMTGRDLRMKK